MAILLCWQRSGEAGCDVVQRVVDRVALASTERITGSCRFHLANGEDRAANTVKLFRMIPWKEVSVLDEIEVSANVCRRFAVVAATQSRFWRCLVL